MKHIHFWLLSIVFNILVGVRAEGQILTDYLIYNNGDTIHGEVEYYDEIFDRVWFCNPNTGSFQVKKEEIKEFKLNNEVFERFKITFDNLKGETFKNRYKNSLLLRTGKYLFFKHQYSGTVASFYIHNAPPFFLEEEIGIVTNEGLFLIKNKNNEFVVINYDTFWNKEHKAYEQNDWKTQLTQYAKENGCNSEVLQIIKKGSLSDVEEFARIINGDSVRHYANLHRFIEFSGVIGAGICEYRRNELAKSTPFYGNVSIMGGAIDVYKILGGISVLRFEMSLQNSTFKNITFQNLNTSAWLGINRIYKEKFLSSISIGFNHNAALISSTSKWRLYDNIFSERSGTFYFVPAIRGVVKYKRYGLGVVSTLQPKKNTNAANLYNIQLEYIFSKIMRSNHE